MKEEANPEFSTKVACGICNGLGATGWGPTAEPCLECGGSGYVPLRKPSEFPTTTIDKELFDELFGKE